MWSTSGRGNAESFSSTSISSEKLCSLLVAVSVIVAKWLKELTYQKTCTRRARDFCRSSCSSTELSLLHMILTNLHFHIYAGQNPGKPSSVQVYAYIEYRFRAVIVYCCFPLIFDLCHPRNDDKHRRCRPLDIQISLGFDATTVQVYSDRIMKQVTIDSRAGGKPGKVWFPLITSDQLVPKPSSSEILVKVIAGALNHRDVFQRQNAYPNLSSSSPVGADGVGIIQGSNRRVVFVPIVSWESAVAAPDGNFGILGGQKDMIGTFTEYTTVNEDQVCACPDFLTDAEAAALPLAGLTAFRAVFTKGQCKAGMNVLIKGIGGGVALFALQFAVAAGASVWVTSGSADKLEGAKKLGAKGGIHYKTEKWGKALAKALPGKIDLVIDSAGGNIVADVLPIIKPGAPIVAYGMTAAPKITFSMAAILANLEY